MSADRGHVEAHARQKRRDLVLWSLEGTLTPISDTTTIQLEPGDCLALGSPAPLRFVNNDPDPIRYLVALTRC